MPSHPFIILGAYAIKATSLSYQMIKVHCHSVALFRAISSVIVRATSLSSFLLDFCKYAKYFMNVSYIELHNNFFSFFFFFFMWFSNIVGQLNK